MRFSGIALNLQGRWQMDHGASLSIYYKASLPLQIHVICGGRVANNSFPNLVDALPFTIYCWDKIYVVANLLDKDLLSLIYIYVSNMFFILLVKW